MKKLIIIFLITINPILGFSQTKSQARILWMDLEKAEKFAEKYNRPMLIYFYRPKCEYCDQMKKETFSDSEITQFINQNFYPVILNGKGKDTIVYNGKTYINQQPKEDVIKKGKKPWRHDLFHELFEENPKNPGYVYPTTFIIDGQHNKIKQITGYQPKLQFLRGLKQSVIKK